MKLKHTQSRKGRRGHKWFPNGESHWMRWAARLAAKGLIGSLLRGR